MEGEGCLVRKKITLSIIAYLSIRGNDITHSIKFLNIWPEAGCPVTISSEIFGSYFGNCNTLLAQQTRKVHFLDMVTFPFRSVTFPRYQQRTERGPFCEFSAANSSLNESENFDDKIWMYYLTNRISAVEANWSRLCDRKRVCVSEIMHATFFSFSFPQLSAVPD